MQPRKFVWSCRRMQPNLKCPVLMEAIKLFNNAANESRLAFQPGLSLELAFAQTFPATGGKGMWCRISCRTCRACKNNQTKTNREKSSEQESIEAVFSKQTVKNVQEPVPVEAKKEEMIFKKSAGRNRRNGNNFDHS